MKALALLLAAALPAQVVSIHNGSAYPWTGWRRVAVSQQPPHVSGWDRENVRYVAGNGFVDIRCQVAAGQTRTIDLATLTPVKIPRPQVPEDYEGHFGGATNLTVVQIVEGGAGFRLDALELAAVWYPCQPGWCSGSLTQGIVQQQGFEPVIGDALVLSPLTFVWQRHVRYPWQDLAAAADGRVVGW